VSIALFAVSILAAFLIGWLCGAAFIIHKIQKLVVDISNIFTRRVKS
jgi:hypothetical protein